MLKTVSYLLVCTLLFWSTLINLTGTSYAQITLPYTVSSPTLSAVPDLVTYLNGNSVGFSELWQTQTDSQGNIVFQGSTSSNLSQFPNTNPDGTSIIKKSFGIIEHDIDAANIAVGKLSHDGRRILWITLIGGSGSEKGGYGLSLDSHDNVYILTATTNNDFYTTLEPFDGGSLTSGNMKAVITKLSSDGQTILYSRYLSQSTSIYEPRGGVAIDHADNVFIAGTAGSTSFLTSYTLNSFQGGNGDAYIVKINPEGQLLWNRFLGAFNDNASNGVSDVTLDVVFDSQNNVFANILLRGNLAYGPATHGSTSYKGGDGDIYAVKLTPDGQTILWHTIIGGSGDDNGERRSAVDTHGNFYLAGYTSSSDLPVTNGSTYHESGDGFFTKLNPSGDIEFLSYFGSPQEDSAYGIVIDSHENILVTGYTYANNLPVTQNAYQASNNGGRDIYFQVFSPTFDLIYATYFGGSSFDRIRNLSIDAQDRATIAGYTSSIDLPVTEHAYDKLYNASTDWYIARFSALTLLQTPTPTISTSCGPPGDIDCNGLVNIFDLSLLLSKYGQSVSTSEDITGDGEVTIFDLSTLLSNFGRP